MTENGKQVQLQTPVVETEKPLYVCIYNYFQSTFSFKGETCVTTCKLAVIVNNGF